MGIDRRDFLKRGSLGLAALGTGILTLRLDAAPTEASGDPVAGPPADPLPDAPAVTPGPFEPTLPNPLGPFFRKNAPYRAKIAPPCMEGKVILIRGRVWAHDTRKPLPGAMLDIWHANRHGRYDNDDPKAPPAPDVFLYRARVMADEAGAYEYETIYPGHYRLAPDVWRASHVHYRVQSPGYRTIVTQMYFKGDKHNAKDFFIKKSLVIDPAERKGETGAYLEGTFDLVLARA